MSGGPFETVTALLVHPHTDVNIRDTEVCIRYMRCRRMFLWKVDLFTGLKKRKLSHFPIWIMFSFMCSFICLIRFVYSFRQELRCGWRQWQAMSNQWKLRYSALQSMSMPKTRYHKCWNLYAWAHESFIYSHLLQYGAWFCKNIFILIKNQIALYYRPVWRPC